MKRIEQWRENKDEYELNDGFILKKADKYEFGIHETIYSNADLELSYSWRRRISAKKNNNNLFWIYKDGKRIGGVHICPNLMGAFFMETPYIYDRFIVISALNNALLQWSTEEESIRIYGVIPEDIDNFSRLGYRIKHSRKVMIRPTEVFEDINWDKDYIVRVPEINDVPQIGKLFFQSYSGGIDYECFDSRIYRKLLKAQIMYSMCIRKIIHLRDPLLFMTDILMS